MPEAHIPFTVAHTYIAHTPPPPPPPPRPDALISIVASSQVNASLCSLQYALNEQLASARPLIVTSQNRQQNFGTGTPKKFFAFKNTESRFSRTK